jgi:hypothetical protein
MRAEPKEGSRPADEAGTDINDVDAGGGSVAVNGFAISVMVGAPTRLCMHMASNKRAALRHQVLKLLEFPL